MLVLLIGFLLLGAGIALTYRLSPIASTRKRAFVAVARVEALRSELHSQQEEIRQAVAQAARHLKSSIQEERLRAMPIDEIKKYSSGLRLQALKDAGMRSVLDLRGVSAQRLSNVRGVGPKSAGSIAGVVELLTRASNELPIQPPSPPFALDRERVLLQSIYCQLFFESKVMPSTGEIESLSSEVQQKLNTVRADSTFLAWCSGFGRSARLRQAKETAELIVQKLEVNAEIQHLRDRALGSLAECRSLSSGRVSPDVLLKEHRAQLKLYDWHLSSALGQANLGPRPTVPIEERLTSAAESGVSPDGGRSDLAEVMLDDTTPSATEEAALVAPMNASGEPAKTVSEALKRLRELQQIRADAKGDASTTDGWKKEEIAGRTSEPDELTTLHVGNRAEATPKEFRLPSVSVPPPRADLRWVVPGESITIQGVSISAAYFYCGSSSIRSLRRRSLTSCEAGGDLGHL